MDSHYCTDPGKFISVLCTSLATMLHVELPHVNLLSKMDLIEHYGKLGKSPCLEQEGSCPTCLPNMAHQCARYWSRREMTDERYRAIKTRW